MYAWPSSKGFSFHSTAIIKAKFGGWMRVNRTRVTRTATEALKTKALMGNPIPAITFGHTIDPSNKSKLSSLSNSFYVIELGIEQSKHCRISVAVLN